MGTIWCTDGMQSRYDPGAIPHLSRTYPGNNSILIKGYVIVNLIIQHSVDGVRSLKVYPVII